MRGKSMVSDPFDCRIFLVCCFVIDRHHMQYCGKLSLEQTVAFICQGHGWRGPNCEYPFNKVEHLDELGFTDGPLHELAEVVRKVQDGRNDG